MAQEWTVYAYSKQQNREVRQFNLTGGKNNPHLTEQQARQWANAFAESLNKQQHLKATDWIARVKYEQLGLDTLPFWNR